MTRVDLFAEDQLHEAVVAELVTRILAELERQCEVVPVSVRGGVGRLLAELEQYLAEIEAGRRDAPDILVVAVDGNCRGFVSRREEVTASTRKSTRLPLDAVIIAVADPHCERWLLLDSAAFKSVLGKGCSAPDHKCDRDRYKEFLAAAVEAAGATPIFHGAEYGSDIARKMDIEKLAQEDKGIAELCAGLRRACELLDRLKRGR
jgi:predicted nucleic acid-binding protein